MDSLTQKIFFLIIKINNFWGDLSGISAKTATLAALLQQLLQHPHMLELDEVVAPTGLWMDPYLQAPTPPTFPGPSLLPLKTGEEDAKIDISGGEGIIQSMLDPCFVYRFVPVT